MITLYCYAPDTGMYLGEVPFMDGVPGTHPPDFTTKTKPEAKDGYFPVWKGDKWALVEDHRGKTAVAKDLSGTLYIETLGKIPTEFTLKQIPPLKQGFVISWSSDEESWIYIEDHRGKHGWVNGVETTIMAAGELPEGWSERPPEPVFVPKTALEAYLEKFADNGNSTEELTRRFYYENEADPIRIQAQGYQAEAAAWRQHHAEEKAVACEAKVGPLLDEYLAVKEDIRNRYPDEV